MGYCHRSWLNLARLPLGEASRSQKLTMEAINQDPFGGEPSLSDKNEGIEDILCEFYFTYLAYAGHKNHRSTLKRMVKLCEESGEVAEAVLACVGSENKTNKIAETGQTPAERLEEELGDVIIAALHIAHTEKLDKLQLLRKATEKMRSKITAA